MDRNRSIYQHENYQSYLQAVIAEQPRGFKTKLSSAMGCQSIYLIRALKGEAQLTEEQAFRGANFLSLSGKETDFFLDLVRLARASEPKLSQYLRNGLRQKAAAMKEVAQRVPAKNINTSLETQVEYYSNWRPAVLHLATNCAHLRTDQALAERFSLDVRDVRGIMNFLKVSGLVNELDGRYQFSGQSIHLPKGSPMQSVLQRERRSLAARSLDRQGEGALHFSSVFATSREHRAEIQSKLLALIEATHVELARTASEELHILAIDFGLV